ncbi:MAG: hypothetical protein ACLP5V_10275 [Candidatus Bathyarchaeia archaeon]
MDDSREDKENHLDWRDYVALTIASLQTILVPFLVVIAIFFVLLFLIR